MKEMSEDAKRRFFDEVRIKLLGESYAPQEPSDGYLPVNWRGEELCLVTAGGGVRYREQDLERDGAREAFNQLVDVVSETAEYMRLMETAPELVAEGLGKNYKLLADFNGAVLAGHPTSHGVELITWEWDYNHASMWHGHYFGGNFANAKTDFAIRANLLDRSMLFSSEQQAEMYRAIHDTLDSVYPMTDKRQKLLEEACEQIERNVPGLQTRVEMSAQLEEQERNRLSQGQELL